MEQAGSPSVVLLTMEGPEHQYVADRFAAQLGDRLRAVIVADAPKQSLARRLRRYWRRYSIGQIASRLYARVWAKRNRKATRRQATLQRVFQNSSQSVLADRHDLVRRVPAHNGEVCQQLIRDLAPDVLAIYGTAMIRSHVIGLAKYAMNMHTGISPRYRGSDSVFWALHNEEPEWVGVTIHMLDAGIDSGPIIATGRPPISSDDDEDSLFAKCVIAGTELYLDAIRAAGDGTLQGSSQDRDSGREYRFVDRTVAAERKVEHLLATGLLRRTGGA